MNELILIRGLPGSGKSTLAKEFVEKGYKHFEADQYFVKSGSYNFDGRKLKDAHNFCMSNTFTSLENGDSVIVSNTFVKLGEMQDYIDFAKKNNIKYTILECNGNWKNIHGVPDNVLQKMKNGWEEF